MTLNRYIRLFEAVRVKRGLGTSESSSSWFLVLEFCGCEKRADCQQRSKIEHEDDDEDDWRYTALLGRYA
jgi:hypothetical protein